MQGLGIPRRSQAVILGWLLLVLRPLSKSYDSWGLTGARFSLFERIYKFVKHEPRLAIHITLYYNTYKKKEGKKKRKAAWVGP